MIDSAAKRRSALRRFKTPLPAPDGSMTLADRQDALWIYRGITVMMVVIVRGNLRATVTLRSAPEAAVTFSG